MKTPTRWEGNGEFMSRILQNVGDGHDSPVRTLVSSWIGPSLTWITKERVVPRDEAFADGWQTSIEMKSREIVSPVFDHRLHDSAHDLNERIRIHVAAGLLLDAFFVR
jgi:hypothetical protein